MPDGAEADEAAIAFNSWRESITRGSASITTDGMALVDLAKDAEDVASALHTIRDSLPRPAATKVTSTISELYALSTALRELEDAQADPRQSPSFYRVQDDLVRLVPSLHQTLGDVLDMFARSRQMPIQMVWEDLRHKMEQDEDASLVERLTWYRGLLQAQLDILNGYQPDNLRGLRRDIRALWSAQQASALRLERFPSHMSSPSTPRPGPSRNSLHRTQTPLSPTPIRPPIQRMETPISPLTSSDDWDGNVFPPVVSDAPNVMPQSPTYTSSSSNTLNSSQTSYSSHNYMAMTPALVHWAQDVFDGQNPKNQFRRSYQAQEASKCYGQPDAQAIDCLTTDGFILALELSFDRDELLLRFYFRPSDSRARIFVVNRAFPRREIHYCIPLTSLKAIRQGSCLLLCQYRKEGKYQPWVRLNFYLYERMVLFYNTFVAMKRQDRREVSHERLLDELELLKPPDSGEDVLFGGVIKDGDSLHALRLFQDRGSGVIRLEACAHRGPMENVPLWTAFVTKYAADPDWASLEGKYDVTLVAIKPHPYVFLSGYHPPMRGSEYLLQFDLSKDARHFMETWTQLCRSNE